MREQSHKDEMRAAVRGDFERLRARAVDPVAPVLQQVDAIPATTDDTPPMPPSAEADIGPDGEPATKPRRWFAGRRKGSG